MYKLGKLDLLKLYFTLQVLNNKLGTYYRLKNYNLAQFLMDLRILSMHCHEIRNLFNVYSSYFDLKCLMFSYTFVLYILF